MKIRYVTELHGDQVKYRRVLEAARKKRVAAVVNGGDMLTLEDDLHVTQKEFIEGFLDGFLADFCTLTPSLSQRERVSEGRVRVTQRDDAKCKEALDAQHCYSSLSDIGFRREIATEMQCRTGSSCRDSNASLLLECHSRTL